MTKGADEANERIAQNLSFLFKGLICWQLIEFKFPRAMTRVCNSFNDLRYSLLLVSIGQLILKPNRLGNRLAAHFTIF